MTRRGLACLLWAVALVGAPACVDDAASGQVTGDDLGADAPKGPDGGEGDAEGDAEPQDDVASDDASPSGEVTCEGREDLVLLIDDLELTLTGGMSPVFDLEVPEGAIAVTVSVVGDDDGMYTVASWMAGALDLVTAGWLQSDKGTQLGVCLGCKNRVNLSEAVAAAIVPNNPNASLPAGKHTVQVAGLSMQGTGKSGKVRVTAYAKVLRALPTTGRLDLNLHFTGAQGLTAATAQQDPTFLAILDEVRTIYAQVGVTLGELAWYDVDSRFQVIETLQGADSDLMEMFRASKGTERNAANLFFVDELASPFGVVLGVAGGIPGPPLQQGTSRSGVAIVVKNVQGVPGNVATTTAHELGHFLGLFHTSENELFALLTGAPVHDPLPDTPEGDSTWLMHNQGSGHKLSEWQGRVIRSNPWVCHPEGQ